MSKPIKIAVSGAMCSGKTTLLDLAQQHYRDHPVVFVPEQARIFFEATPIEGDRSRPEVQDMLLPWIYRAEEAAERSGNQVVVCDRPIFDTYIHLLEAGYQAEAADLLQRIRPWMATYHHILVSDIAGIPHTTDAVRWQDASVRQRMHDLVLEEYARQGISFELLSGSKQQRFDRLRQLVDRHLT